MNTPIKHVSDSGNIEWRLPNGYLHRDDGPALILTGGLKIWYKDGMVHRIDGPAIIHPTGSTAYWIENQEYDPITFLMKSYEYINCTSGV